MFKLPAFLTKPRGFFSNPKKEAQLVSDLGNPAAWLLNGLVGGSLTLSGEISTHETAMELDAYFAAIRNISEDIAKLPFNIFEIVDQGRKFTTKNKFQSLLHDYANPNMSTMDLMQTVIHWAISYGNGYAEIVRNGRGDAVELWPIHPTRVRPFYNKNEKLFYDIHFTGSISGQKNKFVRMDAENVFNLRGLGADGIVGYVLFNIAADSIGQGLAVQKFASAYFGNGTSLSGALETPGKLDVAAQNLLREQWSKIHSGNSANKHKIAVLEQGMKFNPTSSTAAQTQMLESQKFTVERIARLLRIPPHKIGHAAGLVKANFEAENISYFRDTLTPWIKRISLETNRKIIKDTRFTAIHQVNALTLGDSKTRAGVFKTHRNMGTMTINDVLRLEDMNIIEQPWADEHHMQSNITTVENISDGANLKSKGNGQNGASKMEDGEKDPEGRDNVAPAEGADGENAAAAPVDPMAVFENAKIAHLPAFKYASRRIVIKEAKMMNNKLNSLHSDKEGFEKWSNHFFDKQAADIADVFEPCVSVFVNTFPLSIDTEKLFKSFVEYANNYAKDGVIEAMNSWKCQVSGDVYTRSIDSRADRMAMSAINLIGMTIKGPQDEDK